MCTIGLINIDEERYVFKNRDKLQQEREIVSKTEDTITVSTKNSDYFSTGINRYGVAIATTEVRSTEAILSIYADNIDIEKKYSGLIRPLELISQNFHKIRSIKGFLDILSEKNAKFLPYNILISDKDESYLVEVAQEVIKEIKITNNFVKTNHFFQIKYGPTNENDFPSSFIRYKRAKKLIDKINTLNELKSLLIDHRNVIPENNICRHGVYKTISSTILDINRLTMLHTNNLPCQSNYKKYSISA